MKNYDFTKGKELIKQFEGLRLTAYRCPAGVLTIGYGHTSGVKDSEKITIDTAEKYLSADIDKIVKNANFIKACEFYDFNENEASAFLSFVFNLGLGRIAQVTDNFKRDKKTVAEKMLLYVKANGKTLAGLERRRKAEYDLFVTSVSTSKQKTVEIIFRDENGKITERYIANM